METSKAERSLVTRTDAKSAIATLVGIFKSNNSKDSDRIAAAKEVLRHAPVSQAEPVKLGKKVERALSHMTTSHIKLANLDERKSAS